MITLPVAAQATPLKVVNVGAPAVNCVYNTKCSIVVNDTVGRVQYPAISGAIRLQSRNFTAGVGAPAAGKQGYLYRLDLTQVVGVGKLRCVSALKLDFGPVTKLPYVKGGPLSDVYVVTSGGLGSIGIAKADKTGNVITFTFSKPVCAGASAGKGDTSYFFGLTAAKAPKQILAHIQVVGGPLFPLYARVPVH